MLRIMLNKKTLCLALFKSSNNLQTLSSENVTRALATLICKTQTRSRDKVIIVAEIVLIYLTILTNHIFNSSPNETLERHFFSTPFKFHCMVNPENH